MRKYDDEFKRQAVKKILAGQSVASVSRELGVAEGVLHNWKKAKVREKFFCRTRSFGTQETA